ncbi:arsenate reductase (glutaredoxin) [Flavobacterium sp. JP2137]|uniref:arsenate reductase (glutaredoxin) n=1 Tax=Flavobacterium sp. JP2137 TaxID=3414510 RepID=UPI003D2FE4E2
MITIYHNTRCSKSREGLAFLEDKAIPFTVVNYLEQPPSASEIQSLLQKLRIPAIELVRTKESLWKESFRDLNLSDEEIIAALAQNPKLIERPIIVNGDRAVIGRPTEKIAEIL